MTYGHKEKKSALLSVFIGKVTWEHARPLYFGGRYELPAETGVEHLRRVD